MKHLIQTPHLPLLVFLVAAFGFWLTPHASASIGETLSQKWHFFIAESNQQASDHNKRSDCVTQGKEY